VVLTPEVLSLWREFFAGGNKQAGDKSLVMQAGIVSKTIAKV